MASIHIVGEDNYMPYLAVLIKSIRDIHSSSDICIKVLDTGISSTAITSLKRINPHLQFYQLKASDQKILESLPTKQTYMKSPAAYAKCFIVEQSVDSSERILILDADTIIRKPLYDLFNLELGNSPIAAVEQPSYSPTGSSRNTIQNYIKSDRYFNSGVILIDPDNLRKSKLVEKIRATMLEYASKTRFHDQDILNIVFGESFFSLSPSYNWYPTIVHEWSKWPPTSQALPGHFLRRNPHIVHFRGAYKPLNLRCRHRYAHEWREHLRQTDWSKELPDYAEVRNIYYFLERRATNFITRFKKARII